MKISDLLKLSTDNLRRRKGRTALTVIGVVVGTCAIVVMISLGIAMNEQNEAMLQSYGDLTKIQIYNYSYGGTGENSPPVLDDDMLKTIKSIEHVTAATPQYQPNDFNGNIYAGKNDRYEAYIWNAYGMDPDSLEAMGIKLASGRYLTADENLGKNKIPILVGANFGYEFQDTRKSWQSGKRQRYAGATDANGNPLPPFVDINKEKLTLRLTNYDENPKTRDFELVIVGVMEQDYNAGYFTDSGIVMRVSDMKKLEEVYKKLNKGASSGGGSVMISSNGTVMRQKDTGYNQVYVKVDDVDNVAKVEEAIKALGYTDISSLTQIREEMQKSVGTSQMILGGLAAVSLLVAALNIANTMTMAIYERTKEIGVMKVLGCELNKIRSMFLVESGAIGLIGGVLGVVISYIISFVMNNFQVIVNFLGIKGEGGGIDLGGIMGGMFGNMGGGGSISIVPFWLVLLALAFSTIVGLLSGLAPANRAVKISALEAIRHE